MLPGFYRVGSGDTLAGIATAYGRDAASLARWNGLPESAELEPGSVLRVAPPPDDGKPSPVALPQAGAGDAKSANNAVNANNANNAACTANDLSWPASGSVLTAFNGEKTPGITISGEAGEPVKAARSGRVVYTGKNIQGYGLLIIVKHGQGLLTAYGYNERALVKEGDAIKRGQTIAEMGKTPDGKPALLFEVRKNGKPMDPASILKRCDA